jgi:hypothetical protein
MNLMSLLLQRVPDSEQGVCPESDNGGVNVDLSNEDDCVKSLPTRIMSHGIDISRVTLRSCISTSKMKLQLFQTTK